MIHINKSKDNQFYFTVHSSNGQVLATSETYTRKSNCKYGAISLLKHLAGYAKVIDKTC